tara:strand:+ start:224 stop:562 length:339 start_codon:yes stop_codon:yes gene_type:complete
MQSDTTETPDTSTPVKAKRVYKPRTNRNEYQRQYQKNRYHTDPVIKERVKAYANSYGYSHRHDVAQEDTSVCGIHLAAYKQAEEHLQQLPMHLVERLFATSFSNSELSLPTL